MKVLVFTDNDNIRKNFIVNSHQTGFEVSFHEYAQLRKIVKSNAEPAIVYLDIKDRETTFKRELNYLLKQGSLYPAVLDPWGSLADGPGLLLEGAVDYLARTNIKQLFNEQRLKLVAGYLEKYRGDFIKSAPLHRQEKQATENYIPVSGWNEINSGKEHTFSLLYIETDDKDELEKKFNKKHLAMALEIFKKYIERHTVPYNGRLWMWQEFGGIVLFPYTGKHSEAVICALKLELYKFLHYVEESIFPQFLSFRIAIHMGTFVYQQKHTGNIISDTINSIFHLGKNYTKPGDVTITGEVMQHTPEKLKSLFNFTDQFEGRHIYRMRLPYFVPK